MSSVEVKLASGRIVVMNADTPLSACERAADLYGEAAVAWRWPRVWVGPVHHSQVIG